MFFGATLGCRAMLERCARCTGGPKPRRLTISSLACGGTGTVSIINANYNAYRVVLEYANCQGLDGTQRSGLATLDSAKTPEELIVGVDGDGSIVLTLNRS
jgi:hypothetical protein